MSAARTLSITLPPEILMKAEECAVREHCTMDELFGHALQLHVEFDAE